MRINRYKDKEMYEVELFGWIDDRVLAGCLASINPGYNQQQTRIIKFIIDGK